METLRKRIRYFIENQGIKPSEFLKTTSLKKGILDKSLLNSGVTDGVIANILEAYPNINSVWLITGNGNMLLSNNNKQTVVAESDANYKTKQDLILEKLELIQSRLNTMDLTLDYLKNHKFIELTEAQRSKKQTAVTKE